MLILNDLRPVRVSKRDTKRVGRGSGSGKGKRCGRGRDGAKSRSGAKRKAYFEGGQLPLTRRLPKRGFNNAGKRTFQIVNVGDIDKIEFVEKEIDIQWLFNNGLVRFKDKPVKILGNGDISKVIAIKANAFSKTAREKIEKIKGKIEVVGSA